MGAPEDEHIFGVQLRESANDGSDFPNADADYRKVFLGEDGQLHAKDSAGTVTDLGGSGSVATDAIWDAAGDLAVGTGANTAARLAIGSAGEVLTVVAGTASWEPTGGSFWDLVIDEDGSSVANWTARDGTWASTSGEIRQTNAGGGEFNLHYTASLIPTAFLVAECDIFIPTGNSGDDYVGMDLGVDASNTSGTGIRGYLRQGTDAVVLTVTNGGEGLSAATTIALDTWYTLRLFLAGQRLTAWVDGTLLVQGDIGHASNTFGTYFGLWTVNATAHFRNIKVWVPTFPA